MNNLEMSKAIAIAASCLDDLQSESCTGLAYMQTRERARDHVRILHDIAEELAGVQVGEVYAVSDEGIVK